jgi:nitrogen fixation protein FixH
MMTEGTMTADVKKSGPRPSDKWIPWYFVAFFIVLVSVLVPMVYLAVHTLPGTVTNNAYEQGLAYNKAIAKGVQQEALGWKGDVTLEVAQGADTVVTYSLRDANGLPISDADVHLWLVRPAQSGMDRNMVMTAKGDGSYTASVALPAHGQWDVRISALRQGQEFQTQKRMVVP